MIAPPPRPTVAARLIVAAAALLAVGCEADRMAKLDVRVGLDRALTADGTPPNTTVHLVGLTPPEADGAGGTFAAYPVSRYLQPGNDRQADKRRAMLLAEINLGPGHVSDALSKTDPIWARWKKAGVTALAIVSSYPRLDEEPSSAAQDPRRKIVTLDARAWPKVAGVDVTVSDGGVSLTPAPLPLPPDGK